jgi:hypothetical protein
MNNRFLILFFIAALAGFASCKNNDEVFKPFIFTDITVVNASPDTLNFYLNGSRQNNSSGLFPGGYLAHITEPSGLQNYQFKKAGSFTNLFSLSLKLRDSIYNSIYVAGESADKTFNTVDTLLTDTLPNIATVRFVHAAPDAGSLNVFVGDTVNFKARSFKTSSVFLTIGSGQKEVKIYQFGSATPKIDTIITIQPNKTYTLFAKGLLNGKGSSAFNVGVILNL